MNRIIAIFILIVLLVFLGFWLVKKTKDKLDNKKAKKEFESNIITGNAGGVSYSLNPATTADEIYDALHNSCLWGMCEHEQVALVALLNTPKQFIPQVADAYMKLHKLNLESDLTRLLDNENWQKVRYLFN